MFRGRSAWFSQSVPPEIRCLWVGEGGVIVNLEAADYLFSSDASHPDTKRIYQSLDYLEDRVTVFIPAFLPRVSTSGPTPESKSIQEQERLRDKKELDKWYKSEWNQHQGPSTTETRKLTYIPLQDYPSSNMVTGYTSGKAMKKFLGEIRDFIPGCSGYLAYWVPNQTNVFSDVKMTLKRTS
ncbi:telomere repeats-binding bouquet formation protein 2 [Thamnophis elegans]|uniref:telomere repeats-binding bouquet formation protein 2 n=1 Tax=Thamnophis elegans TaxID=35005 RepID=UPI001376AD42|nr:telomere repeats-binding bouquet formation protein 2 [Thamnophis elegans]